MTHCSISATYTLADVVATKRLYEAVTHRKGDAFRAHNLNKGVDVIITHLDYVATEIKIGGYPAFCLSAGCCSVLPFAGLSTIGARIFNCLMAFEKIPLGLLPVIDARTRRYTRELQLVTDEREVLGTVKPGFNIIRARPTFGNPIYRVTGGCYRWAYVIDNAGRKLTEADATPREMWFQREGDNATPFATGYVYHRV